MEQNIFHIANAGLYFWNGKTGLLVDALFQGKSYGFSDFPLSLSVQMENHQGIFGNTNDLLFTHKHIDHYQEKLVETFIRKFHGCKIYCPVNERSNVQTKYAIDGVETLDIEDYHIFSIKTIHDGKNFEDEPHRSYVIQSEGVNYLLCGDAIVDETFFEKVKALRIDSFKYVFLNLYQLSNKKTMEQMKQLQIEKMVVYHLPFSEDDQYHYWKFAEKLLTQIKKETQTEVVCMKPMTYLSEL